MVSSSKSVLPGSKRVVEEIQPKSKIKLVGIQSLIDAHITHTGRTSGRQYVWERAGAIVECDEQDVPELLALRRGKRPCCGQEPPLVFQLA